MASIPDATTAMLPKTAPAVNSASPIVVVTSIEMRVMRSAKFIFPPIDQKLLWQNNPNYEMTDFFW
jgi:hypothetical protein